MSDKGRPLPKFGEWDVNDPASAEGFTVIFNKARDERKTGAKPMSPSKSDHGMNYEGWINSWQASGQKMVLLCETLKCGILTTWTFPSKGIIAKLHFI